MKNDKQTSKHKLGNRTNRWSKVQADARCLNSKKQLKQQRYQRQRPRRLKKDLIFNLRISREVEFIQFVSVYIVSELPNRICKTLQNLTKEILKIKFTFSQISRTDVLFSRCCIVSFGKEQQRNKQEIITHAYTAITLFAVAVEFCLI